MSVAKQGEGSVSGSESEKGKYIKLKVIGDAVMEFRIRTTSKLDRIINEYCARVRIPKGNLKFLFDGKRIAGLTPKMMEMQDNDVIEVMAPQDGGNQPSSGRP